MNSISADVSPAVASLIITYWRETPIWQKLSYVNELNETVRILALSDLR